MYKDLFVELPIKLYSRKLANLGLEGNQNPSHDSFMKLRKDKIISYRETEDDEDNKGVSVEMAENVTWFVYLSVEQFEKKIFGGVNS